MALAGRWPIRALGLFLLRPMLLVAQEEAQYALLV